MKRFFIVIALFLSLSNALFSGDVEYESNTGYKLTLQELPDHRYRLNIFPPEYRSQYGMISNVIEYFYLSCDENLSVFFTSRYVREDNVETFFQSLIPLEENLLPYAIPSTSEYVSSRVIAIEESNLSGIPAKKITFALYHGNSADDEILISYVLTKPRSSLIHWDKIAGYTFSISFTRSNYETQKDQIDSLIQNLVIN